MVVSQCIDVRSKLEYNRLEFEEWLRSNDIRYIYKDHTISGNICDPLLKAKYISSPVVLARFWPKHMYSVSKRSIEFQRQYLQELIDMEADTSIALRAGINAELYSEMINEQGNNY